MNVKTENMTSEMDNDDKDIWRNIFFTLSSGLASKTIQTVTGSEAKPMNAQSDNPQIDIKRLVNFLHTRDMSSRKVNFRFNREKILTII